MFTSPDTLIPDPFNPLDWNRYSYVKNNPIKYNDPTGHCTSGDKVCLDTLAKIQKDYNVTIDDSSKLWTLESLDGIRSGMDALISKIGKVEFDTQFAGVKFLIGGEENRMSTTGNNDILLGNKVLNNKKYITEETVHELAHIWDKNCDDCKSKGLVKATGGKEEEFRILWWTLSYSYKPDGITATNYGMGHRREDWAESVTAMVFPGYATNNPWDQRRQDYVNTFFITP